MGAGLLGLIILGWATVVVIIASKDITRTTEEREMRMAEEEAAKPLTEQHQWWMKVFPSSFEYTEQEVHQFRDYLNLKSRNGVTRPVKEDVSYILHHGSISAALPGLKDYLRRGGKSVYQVQMDERAAKLRAWVADTETQPVPAPAPKPKKREPKKRSRMEREPVREAATDPGIYLLEIGDVFYYGQSKHLGRRERDHIRDLSRSRHSNQYLQEAFDSEGIDGFNFTVVERCPINELNRKEQKMIDLAYDDENCANKQRTVTHRARRNVV